MVLTILKRFNTKFYDFIVFSVFIKCTARPESTLLLLHTNSTFKLYSDEFKSSRLSTKLLTISKADSTPETSRQYCKKWS